jgi:hypothetical protein
MLKYNRFFSFGCSFTKYKWPTWADILGKSFQEYHNFGEGGAGNFYIFLHIMKAINDYQINNDDLVIVEWSGLTREDRFIKGKWNLSGNVYGYHNNALGKNFVENIFDPEHCLIRDYTLIAAAYELLEKTKCKFLFTSMMSLEEFEKPWTSKLVKIKEIEKNKWVKSFDRYLKHFLPSFKEALYNNDWTSIPRLHHNFHPTPLQHLEFIKKVLIPNIDSDIVLDEEYIKEITIIENKIWSLDAKL